MAVEFIIIDIFMFVLGAVLGSFACCQAWRIHEKNDKSLGKRSVCMHCKKQLSWFDNIPIFSWLFLRGKCRFCHQKIGLAEILSEISLGLAFLAVAFKYTAKYAFENSLSSSGFYGLTKQPVTFFIPIFIILIMLVLYWIVMIYDAKWGELPVSIMIVEIILALTFQFLNNPDWFRIFISVGILAGTYYLLYFFSKEKLVGGGDWILCMSIAIILGRFEFAIVELFLSNLMASFAGIPQALKKEKKPIPFGPFLILAMLIIFTFSDFLTKFLVIH